MQMRQKMQFMQTMQKMQMMMDDAGNSIFHGGLPTIIENVLIAEDEADYRDFLKAMLARIAPNLRIFEAADGNQAINMMLANRIDALLCDYRLPIIDGRSVLQSIKSMKEGLRPKRVLLITGMIDEKVSEKFGNLLVDCLPKTIKPAELEEYLKHLLNRK